MDTVLSDTDVRNNNRFWKSGLRKEALAMLDSWKPMLEKYNCSYSSLVIALTAATIPDLHILCGARKPEQLIDNASALSLKLDAEDIRQMLAAVPAQI